MDDCRTRAAQHFSQPFEPIGRSYKKAWQCDLFWGHRLLYPLTNRSISGPHPCKCARLGRGEARIEKAWSWTRPDAAPLTCGGASSSSSSSSSWTSCPCACRPVPYPLAPCRLAAFGRRPCRLVSRYCSSSSASGFVLRPSLRGPGRAPTRQLP